MNDFLANIFVFTIVLVIYLHIYKHSKQSNDLEVFEIENSNERLDEVLECLQPTLFDIFEEESLSKTYISKTYHAFEINIRDLKDIETKDSIQIEELYLPFVLKDANILFQNDTNKIYFSENNQEFLVETGLIKKCHKYDEVLRPPMCCNSFYDLLLGTTGVETPLRYHLNYRNYFVVTGGKIKIRMTPPKSSKFLNPIYDYENFEFRSTTNLWLPENESHKIKCLEVELTTGRMISIPPYWWYTIKLLTDDTSIATFSYRTYMNNISISPYLFITLLQQNNVKQIISKTIHNDQNDLN
jgi:hypothetical protein